jgi:hypothetical protein
MMSAEVQRGHRAHFEVSRVNASEFFSSLLASTFLAGAMLVCVIPWLN